MRALVFGLFFGLFLSVTAFANEEFGLNSVNLSVVQIPARPVVIDANKVVEGPQGQERTIQGPWVKFDLSMTNSSEDIAVITEIHFTVYISGRTNSTKSYNVYLEEPIEINCRESLVFTDYLENLPVRGRYDYRVNGVLKGWFEDPGGTPTNRLQKEFRFQTK